MRVAIIGQQLFGKAVMEAFLNRGDEIAGVFTVPEKTGALPDPLRLAAESRNITVLQMPRLTDSAAEDAMRSLNADIGIMAYVLQFAPQDFVNIPKYGTIQYHPSLLPKHRGPSSINWALACGETETGITIFRPTDGLDEGPIVLQKHTQIHPDDTAGSVYFNRLFPMGVAAMLEAADLIVDGKHSETEQDNSQASYEGWFRAAEAKINWHNHVSIVYNLIRGSDPQPGAWTTLNGEKIQVYSVRMHPFGFVGEARVPIGCISEIGEKSFRVKCRGGLIEVFVVRTPDANKMSAIDFVRQKKLEVGSCFHS